MFKEKKNEWFYKKTWNIVVVIKKIYIHIND